MRSLHPANAVHKGFGTIPTSILQRKNGVCIYERPACYHSQKMKSTVITAVGSDVSKSKGPVCTGDRLPWL